MTYWQGPHRSSTVGATTDTKALSPNLAHTEGSWWTVANEEELGRKRKRCSQWTAGEVVSHDLKDRKKHCWRVEIHLCAIINKEQTERWQSGDMPYGSALVFACICVWGHSHQASRWLERWDSYRGWCGRVSDSHQEVPASTEECPVAVWEKGYALLLERALHATAGSATAFVRRRRSRLRDWNLNDLLFVDLLFPFVCGLGKIEAVTEDGPCCGLFLVCFSQRHFVCKLFSVGLL